MIPKLIKERFLHLVDEGIEKNNTISSMKSDISQLKADVAELKADVAELKADVAELKADVAELKADVAELKADVAELKVDVAWLKTGFQRHEMQLKSLNEGMHRQGILMEELRDQVKLIAEAVAPLLQKTEGLENLNQKIDDNEDHIVVVESALKSHINDKNIHKEK